MKEFVFNETTYIIKSVNEIDINNRLEFCNIPGFEDYLINGYGAVYSLKSQNFLSRILNSSFYFSVCLYLAKGKNQKTRSLQKLLAITFIPNPHDYKFVEFIDGDRDNLHVNNVQWAEKKRVSTVRRNYASKGKGLIKRGKFI